MHAPQYPLILASNSVTRKTLLENAGLTFTVKAAAVDEAGIKDSLIGEGAPDRDIVDVLAEMKAVSVSRLNPGALVIGADQILVVDGVFISKAKTTAQAKAVLQGLAGRDHSLMSAAVIALDGQPIWRAMESAHLTMRPLNDAFIDQYLQAVGDKAFMSVGCYQLEGMGVQLLNRVEGDFFTVLGLPLLKLLDFLRRYGVVET